jgi:phage virion morphogenesis protein
MIVQKAGRISKATNEALRKAGEEEVRRTQQRLATEKRTPDGQPWAPWSLATLRQRTREGTLAGGLLNRTGALINSIAFKITQATLTVFSSAPYAKYLQLGTGKMPARPFIGWSKDGVNSVREYLKSITK